MEIWGFLVYKYMKNFIFIFGPQGSGKSTQAEILAEKLNYIHISSGEVLREMKDAKDPLGVELAEKYWLCGNLIPDNLMAKLLFKKFKETEANGFVVEGYPRNMNQLVHYLEKAEENDWYLERVYYILVSEEVCLERIANRVKLEDREDETKEAIIKRLDIYHSETTPVIDEFEKMGILVKVDGERSIEDISSDII